jgi:hypothetical protein
MSRLQRTSLLLFGTLFLIAACVVPNITITDPIAEVTVQALTVEAIVRATQQAEAGPLGPSASAAPSQAAASPTVTETATNTSTPTYTPSPLPIFTVTPFVPLISVSVATNCREGPGKAYAIVGALLVGETAQALARDPTGEYWYIPNPDAYGEYCWVWGEYATLTGLTASLPVFTPQPTPSPTATPTPSPGFNAEYDGLVSCTAEWWPEIVLENTGQLTFRSMEITVRDTVLDTSVSDETNGFKDRPNCSTSTSKVSLAPGKFVTISSPALEDDPHGHKLRATITLCSETGQDGTCITEKIDFKP